MIQPDDGAVGFELALHGFREGALQGLAHMSAFRVGIADGHDHAVRHIDDLGHVRKVALNEGLALPLPLPGLRYNCLSWLASQLID